MKPKRQIIPFTFDEVLDKAYNSCRGNQERIGRRETDLIASIKRADQWHALIQEYVKATYAFPMPIDWEIKRSLVGLECRSYASLIFRGIGEIHVIIAPSCYKDIFACPNYIAQHYWCFLRKSMFPFPNPTARAWFPKGLRKTGK